MDIIPWKVCLIIMHVAPGHSQIIALYHILINYSKYVVQNS